MPTIIKKLWNYFIKSYSYFHRKKISYGFPEIYTLELTNHCAMSCRMCPHDLMKRSRGFMSFETFKKVIDQIKPYANRDLCIHGIGDSLLHPDLREFVRYAKSKNISLRVSTNPISLTEKSSHILIEEELDHLFISLDGINPETYRYLRGERANYQQALKRIQYFIDLKKALKKKKPYIEISMIRLKETEKEVEEFKKKWETSGVDNVLIKAFKTWDGSIQSIKELASPDQLSDVARQKERYSCIRPWLIISILWDGRVVPCCYDYDAKYVIGSVNEESIKEIWNNKKMQELRRTLTDADFTANKLCASCIEGEGAPPSRIYPLDIVRKLFELKPNKIITYFFKRST